MKFINRDISLTNTLLCDFATPGLYSMILEKRGNYKRRLFVFIADPNKPDQEMGEIPIHAHKYIDEMEYLFGHVEDFCYAESKDDSGIEMQEYKYARLNQDYHPLQKTGASKKFVLLNHHINEDHKIYGHHLHTVFVKGTSAWIINELAENELYPQYYAGKCYSVNDIDGSFVKTRPGGDYSFALVKMILKDNGYHLSIDDNDYGDLSILDRLRLLYKSGPKALLYCKKWNGK